MMVKRVATATAWGWRDAASPSVSTRTRLQGVGCEQQGTFGPSHFRKDNVDALSGLFVQVLALCQQAGLVKLGHVALDGTKVKANASKHKAKTDEGEGSAVGGGGSGVVATGPGSG